MLPSKYVGDWFQYAVSSDNRLVILWILTKREKDEVRYRTIVSQTRGPLIGMNLCDVRSTDGLACR